MRIHYVHFCCQPTPHLRNYLSLGLHFRKTELVILCCYDVQTVAAMTGQPSGFITWVKEVASECEST